jgi:hypothetical protein
MKFVSDLKGMRWRHGAKYRTIFGHMTTKNDSFVIDYGGCDMLMIDEEKMQVFVLESFKPGYSDDVKLMKCTVLGWLDMWDDFSKDYWTDRFDTMRIDIKTTTTDHEYNTKWHPFIQQCGFILMDKEANKWKPAETIDGLKIYK